MQKPFNLFVYGTLMNPLVFRAVLGKRLVTMAGDADGGDSFLARDAVLDGYKKISPDSTYNYAVPEPHSRIRGYIIGPLPGSAMEQLRKFEGRNYSRRTLRVHSKKGYEQVIAFVGNLQRMEHSFGYPFRDPLKQEILLRQKIEAALLEAEREQLHTDESVARRALGELHGATIRDLVRRHFEAGGISDYAINRSIKSATPRDYSRVMSDPQATPFVPNYLRMVVRQVIFNQVEERIRQDFRYELDQMNTDRRCYERAISSLTALRMLNTSSALLDTLCADCLAEFGSTGFPAGAADQPGKAGLPKLIDYVHWAIVAADAVFEPTLARRELAEIRANTQGGFIPLGAELEFSNTGHDVIRDPHAERSRDAQYDGFLYFRDFALDVLTWKLGGHIDDHHEKASTRPRRGFFETALGSLSLEPNLSMPITVDPWQLNQFIHQTMRFYDIVPHSVHISLQLRSQHKPHSSRLLPLYAIKCLLAIAGDPGPDASGQIKIRRISAEEIVRVEPAPNLLFCEISKRHSADLGEDLASRGPNATGRYVQQYKFLRLSPQINYEALAVALKGLQMSLRPGSFLTPTQYRASRQHREMFHAIMDWSAKPTPISQPEVYAFLGHIYDGLASEHQGRPVYTEAYMTWVMDRLREPLAAFNASVSPQGVRG